MKQKEIEAFFALLRAGLFGHTEITDSTENVSWQDVDWVKVYQLAEEQSVIGLIAAGIDSFKEKNTQDSQVRMSDHGSSTSFKCPQEWALQFIGSTLQIEQRNKDMNAFVARLIERLRKKDIYAVLVKGQGIAQCYERPLWRASGDVDLLLSDDNYAKAKDYLIPLASSVETEDKGSKHLGMQIDSWEVELHGSLRVGLPYRINNVLNKIKEEIFYGGYVRSWLNGNTQIFLPGINADVVYVFVHFFNHFYKGGIGLRQICDWCRLLWTYRESLNHEYLGSKIREAGLISEWKAFYNLASRYLGMPDLDSRFMVYDSRYDKKADRIMEFILEVGNMGHKRDMSYYDKYPYVVRKLYSMKMRVDDLINHARIFPLDSLSFFPRIMFNGLRSAVRGE